MYQTVEMMRVEMDTVGERNDEIKTMRVLGWGGEGRRGRGRERKFLLKCKKEGYGIEFNVKRNGVTND